MTDLQAGCSERSNPAAEAFQRRIPGISEESARKGISRWREEIWGSSNLSCRPFWWAMAGCIVVGSRAAAEPLVCFLVLHEPMDVQLHCVIKIRLQLKRKKIVFPIQASSMQFEWNIEREHSSYQKKNFDCVRSLGWLYGFMLIKTALYFALEFIILKLHFILKCRKPNRSLKKLIQNYPLASVYNLCRVVIELFGASLHLFNTWSQTTDLLQLSSMQQTNP